MNLEIYNETNTETPIIDFLKLKNKILGENFELTISILSGKNSLKINKKQRKKDYTPNTLSFKYSDNSGEIIFTPEVISEEEYEICGKTLQNTQEKYLFLAIHSMIHLKDIDHGEEMESLEEKYFQEFK